MVKTATTHPETCAALAPTPFIQLAVQSSVQRGQGTCEALAFLLKKQSSTFQKTGADDDSLLGLWTAWQRDEGSPERRYFFLSLSFSYLNSHVSKFSHP